MTGRFVVVTPNPALDVTYRVDRQIVGETVRVREVRSTPGGKGINVARVLRTLGRDVVAVQPLGGPAGEKVRAGLAAAGVPAHVVPISGETRSTVTIVDGAQHPTVYTEPGPAVAPDDTCRLTEAVAESCRPGDRLVVGGSMPPGMHGEHVRALVTAARDAGARSVVDTTGDALLAACRAGADVVMPNADEAGAATGAEDLDGAIRALLELGAGAVVVSRGHYGLLAVTRDGHRAEQIAVPGVTGDPTGAGDAATAGFAAACEAGADLTVALRCAAVCGAAALLQPVAGHVEPADLIELDLRLAAVPGPATTDLLLRP